MSWQQTTQESIIYINGICLSLFITISFSLPYTSLKDLYCRILLKRDIFNNKLDCPFEFRDIPHYQKGVKGINQSERVVSKHIIDVDIGSR